MAALLAVASADVLSHPFIPSQNSASSASETLNAGTLYNQNSYARDDSKIRQHSTILANSAENTKDVATAISEPAHLAAIETLPPYYLTPAERLYPYYSLPGVEKIVPFLSQPAVEQVVPLYSKPAVEQVVPLYNKPAVEQVVPLYSKPVLEQVVPLYSKPSVEQVVPFLTQPTAEQVISLFSQPSVEQIVPVYNPPAEFTYPYVNLPLETTYPYVVEQGYYGFPSSLPIASPAINVPTETFLSFPNTGLLEAQQQIPFTVPRVPLYQPGALFGEALSAPVEFIDTTLLEAFYPELPTHTHFSANNKLKTASASATPISSSSESLSDSTAFSKDTFPILTQKKFSVV